VGAALKADKPDTEATVYDSVKKKLGEAQENCGGPRAVTVQGEQK